MDYRKKFVVEPDAKGGAARASFFFIHWSEGRPGDVDHQQSDPLGPAPLRFSGIRFGANDGARAFGRAIDHHHAAAAAPGERATGSSPTRGIERPAVYPQTCFAADQNWIQHVLTHGGQQRLEPSLREDLEIPRQCTILDLVEEPPLVDAHNGGINHLHGRV